MPQEEKIKAADEAIRQIKEKFGDGSIMRLGEAKRMEVEAIPCGCLSLDLAIGGGFPRGRIIEIFGDEASGKTTLALHLLASVQKNGGTAAFVDAEHALDPDYAKKIGVKIDNLLISQPDTGEQALEIVETLTRSNGVDAIVIDSVAALTPKAEIEGEMGDQFIGLQARLMSQALRKLAGIVSKTRTIIIFLNQTRQKIGIMWGSPTTTSGGTALKFYSSVRLELKKIGQIKKGETQVVGNRIKVKVVKNKVAPPFKVVEFDIMYNEGISVAGDLIDLGMEKGVVKKSGNTFSFGEVKLGVGREAARDLLRKDLKLIDEIKKKIMVQIKVENKEEAQEEKKK
jgi:recombination protein RecA